MGDLEIFAFILGDSPPSKKIFSVRAPESMSVAECKNLIYATAKSRIEGVAAIDLVLWKVRLLYSLCRPKC
jgi:hypothetical protein